VVTSFVSCRPGVGRRCRRASVRMPSAVAGT